MGGEGVKDKNFIAANISTTFNFRLNKVVLVVRLQ